MSSATASSTLSRPVFKRASIGETAVLLALAALIPFLVHLLPWHGARPLGAYLLPVFWTTFVAAYFFGAWTAVLVGLCSPVLNLALTGLPLSSFLLGMSAELIVFAVVAALVVKRWPRLLVTAPLAYGVAHSVLLVFQAGARFAGAWADTLRFAAVGLVVLAVINIALVKYYPKSR